MKHKLLSLSLVLIMCISLFPLSALATGYSDTAGHWAEGEIAKWSEAGILKGSDGSFRPNDSITRAEMATIFDRLMACQTKAANSFADLDQSWYTDAVLRANAAGLMLGSNGLVRPKGEITRQEAAILVCRAIGIPEKSGSTSFADDTNIASWAKGYVNALSSAGLIVGVGNNCFAPADSINRASVVKMLDNAIKGFYPSPGKYTGDIQGNVVVNSANTTLKNMKISGNLIVAEGVGNGDVYLDNVNVAGRMIVRGGGANSIHITGSSQIASIIIQKTDGGGIRVVTGGDAIVEAVFIDDGKDDIILTGSFEDVTVATDAPVLAVGASIANIAVTSAGASLTVDSITKVTAVTFAKTAAKAEISVKGEIGNLTTDAEIKVDNQGAIKKAVIKADNVIIDGNKPAEVTVDSSVKEPPKGSDGKPIESDDSGVKPPAKVRAIRVVGVPVVGIPLTVETTPGGAAASGEYQWFIAGAADGEYEEIDGATDSTYTPVGGDFGKYIKVKFVASGNYSGAVTSDAVGPIETVEEVAAEEDLLEKLADENVSIIKLGADIKLSQHLNVTRDVVIDGKGYSLTRDVGDTATDNESYVIIVFSGKLTAKNINLVSNNTQTDPIANAVGITVQADAALDLDNAIITSSSEKRSAYGIYLQDGAGGASITNTEFKLSYADDRVGIAMGLESTALEDPNPFSILTKDNNIIPEGAFELAFYVPAGFGGDPVAIMEAALADGQQGLYWGDKKADVSDLVITSAKVVKDEAGNLVLTVAAEDENLYSLEVDHSHGKHGKWASAGLPEFSPYTRTLKIHGVS